MEFFSVYFNLIPVTLVQGLALGAAATMVGTGTALAQTGPAAPPTTITTPPRDFSPRGAPTTYFWDPDILAVDPSFNDLAQPNTAIKRLHTGLLWAEGPAWNGVGRIDGSDLGASGLLLTSSTLTGDHHAGSSPRGRRPGPGR